MAKITEIAIPYKTIILDTVEDLIRWEDATTLHLEDIRLRIGKNSAQLLSEIKHKDIKNAMKYAAQVDYRIKATEINKSTWEVSLA